MTNIAAPPSESTQPVNQDSGAVAKQESPPQVHRTSLRSLRAGAEVAAIRDALQQTGWNRKRAAELLSISYRGLLYKISQHHIAPEAGGKVVSSSATRNGGSE